LSDEIVRFKTEVVNVTRKGALEISEKLDFMRLEKFLRENGFEFIPVNQNYISLRQEKVTINLFSNGKIVVFNRNRLEPKKTLLCLQKAIEECIG